MNCYVGLDIGAVSITAALLVKDGAADSLPKAGFTACGRFGGGALYINTYRRTRGRPIQAATEVLESVIAAVGAESVRGVSLTGCAAKLVAGSLNCRIINEFKATALGLSALGRPVRTVFEMGGQTSKYLLMDVAQPPSAGKAQGKTEQAGKPVPQTEYSITDYGTNGDCAAGTGSFIDQQAGRLKYAVEDVGRIALESQRRAQVAGRCSVFAKSDMIHAQQKGYTPGEVLGGLCMAVARNFRMAVVRSHPVEAPVAFIGGLAANAAVVSAMREIFGLSEQDLFVPEGFAHVAAMGAAIGGLNADAKPAPAPAKAYDFAATMQALRAASDAAHDRFPTAPPLVMDRVRKLSDQVDPYQLPFGQERVDAYMGIDIGSVSTNVVLIDPEGNVIKDIYVRTQGRPVQVVTQCLKDVQAELGDRVLIRGVGTTGSGRELIGELVGADTVNDEITAHKTGATFIGQRMLDGRVPDTIFEIGGQDSKFISLQDGIVVDFTMNEACAAGTGSFLEERAEELEIAIINEFAELALSSAAPIRLGERCTVFMERDVNDYLQKGAAKSDLVAGLAYSVVYNYINRVVRGRKIGDTIFFQGGTAYNDAVAAAFSAVLEKEIIVPPYNGVMGAIGAALLARDKMVGTSRSDSDAASVGKSLGTYVSQLTGETSDVAPAETSNRKPLSRFRGYDMSKVKYALREFTCKGCSNQCIMQEFDVEGEKTFWGDKCSEKYRKRSKAVQSPVIEDIFALREKLINDESLGGVASAAGGPSAVGTQAGKPVPQRVMGIPRAMFGMDFLPFWRTFWQDCGFKVIVSDLTNRQTAALGAANVVAEPCFPVIVAHGHLAQLLEKNPDYVFLPNTVSAQTQWMDNESYLCPWNQTLPFVLRRVPAFEPHMKRFISPSIRFRTGKESVAKVLVESCRPLGIRPEVVRSALDRAYQAQDAFRQALLSAGRRALDTLEQTGKPGIVIIGRPYNIHDPGVNLSVARKLRDYYGVNCIPIDCLDVNPIDIRDVDDNMYWDYGRKLLAAAKIVGDRPNLHIIHITNFKCGPDSFIKHFIRTAGGKPFLSLQFDGHSNDAGMMTRCEAYLDSKGILRPWKKAGAAEDAAVASG